MAIPTLNASDIFGASERGLAARNVNLLRGQEQEDRRNTLAAQQQAAAQQQVINRLIAENTGPDGNVDRAGLSVGLANAGLGGAIFGAQENVDKNAAAVANIGKTRADTLAKTFETSQKNRDYYNRAMAELANRPDLSRDMVIQTGRDLAAQGVIDPKVIESGAGALPNDPAQLRRVLTEGLRTQLTPEQQVNFFAPKPTEVDLDGSVEFVDTNPNSPTYRKPVASRPKSMTPGEAARLAEERRQFGITESRAEREARDRATGAAGPPPKKEPSVAEIKDAYNAQRLLSSLRSIKEATSKDPGAASPGFLEAAALSSPFGMFEPAANLVRGDQRQIVAAAQSDAIDTLLFLATGAAYNKEQLESQRQAYLVNFTDRAEVRKDKRRRLEDLVKAARVRAGRAWTPELEAELQSILTPAGAAAPAGASAGDDVVDTSNPLLQ